MRLLLIISSRIAIASRSPTSLLEKFGQVLNADANRVAYTRMRQLAAFTQTVHDGRAHAETLSNFANRKQRFKGTPAGKMF